MISLWEQYCNDDNRLLKIERWLVYHFPDSSANWIIESPGHNVQTIGDGLLLSRCHSVLHYYTVFRNCSISHKCFHELPVQILPTKTIMFLQFLNRKLIPHGTRINCTLVLDSTFFEDISGQLWHLTQNGTVSKFKSRLLFASLNELNFRLPKLRGFSSHLVRPHFHKLDQPTVLDLISANHQSLQEISQITDVGQGSFLQGLGSLFGITNRSLAQGGKTIITTVGNGVKHGFEGLGTFSHDLTTGVGNATGTIIQSTGHAFNDVASGTGTFFQKFSGSISGTILWTVILLIIIYLVYLKFAHLCFNRSAEPVEQVQERQRSTLDVSVPSSSDCTEQYIHSKFDKITGVSPQSPPKSQHVFVRFSKKQNKATIATV